MANTKKYHPTAEWLTEEYMEDKLRKYYKDENLVLVSLEKIPASAIGENFVSVITRLKAEFYNSKKQKHKETFLTKTTYPENDPSADFFIKFGAYVRELDMYEFVLPKLTEIMREISDNKKLFADTIYVDREHLSIIIEDLSQCDFEAACRIKRLDMEHAKLTLQKLAEMHATAKVLSVRSPGIFAKNFDRCFFNRHTDGYKVIMTGMLESLMRYIATVPTLNEKYYHKISELRENIMEYGARVTDANDVDFMTLTHGDYWTTNFLFKYSNDKKPSDVIPIDFQFSVWGSPAIDLLYFYHTSLQEDLRLNHTMELQQFYYYHLVDALKQLKYKGHVPTLFEFNLQVESRSFYAVFASLIFQPIMVYNGKEEASFQNLLMQTEPAIRFRDSVFKNEMVQKYLVNLLPLLDQKGLLDKMY